MEELRRYLPLGRQADTDLKRSAILTYRREVLEEVGVGADRVLAVRPLPANGLDAWVEVKTARLRGPAKRADSMYRGGRRLYGARRSP